MIEYNPNFYSEDIQAGENCFFGNRDAYIDFNADLKSFELKSGKMSTDYARNAGDTEFNLFQFETEPMKLIAEFYVGGASFEDAQSNISGLLLSARRCVITKEGDIFEYPAVLVENEVEATEVEPYFLVTCSFAVIRRKPLVTHRLEGTKAIIFNEGNAESGMRYTIFPKKQTESLVIAGITIHDLAPGTTYCIDGIQGRVTADGINYFDHIDIIDFPKVKPGRNEITMSEEIPAEVSFYPVFS